MLWLVTGLKSLLHVNRVKMNPQRYFKKTGTIVWNAGKNEHTPFIKAAVQSQVEEPGYQFLSIEKVEDEIIQWSVKEYAYVIKH
jgi:hypothetical protein